MESIQSLDAGRELLEVMKGKGAVLRTMVEWTHESGEIKVLQDPREVVQDDRNSSRGYHSLRACDLR